MKHGINHVPIYSVETPANRSIHHHMLNGFEVAEQTCKEQRITLFNAMSKLERQISEILFMKEKDEMENNNFW